MIYNTLHSLSMVSIDEKCVAEFHQVITQQLYQKSEQIWIYVLPFSKFSKCNNNNRKEWNDKRLILHTACCVKVHVTAPEGDSTDVNKCAYALTFSVAHGMSEFCVTPAER
jgi:hypothetical protein